MEATSVQSKTPTAVRTDLGAIFVSLELSRSTWLITSLSPGNGEKMSKHVVEGGNIAELLARFEQLQLKARLRTGKSFPIVTIQEAGLDVTNRATSVVTPLQMGVPICGVLIPCLITVLTPMEGKVEIDVRGDLAGILTLSVERKNPAAVTTGSQVKLVAGA